MIFGIPPGIYFLMLITISADAVAVVSFIYAIRHWKQGGYIRLARGIVCTGLAVLSMADLLDKINNPDISYVYNGFIVMLLAIAFANAVVEM
jgi:hypothetical protein